jgi:hypothetical protein
VTNEQLFAILRPIVMTVTGVPECILADQNAKSPTGEYASIRPRQSITQRGQAHIYPVNKIGDQVTVDVRAQVIATATVNFYRGDAMARVERLQECHKRPDISMNLFRAKVRWLGTSAANNLTALQSVNWEQRSQISIRLGYEVSNINDINNILSACIVVENEKAQVLQRICIASPPFIDPIYRVTMGGDTRSTVRGDSRVINP